MCLYVRVYKNTYNIMLLELGSTPFFRFVIENSLQFKYATTVLTFQSKDFILQEFWTRFLKLCGIIYEKVF